MCIQRLRLFQICPRGKYSIFASFVSRSGILKEPNATIKNMFKYKVEKKRLPTNPLFEKNLLAIVSELCLINPRSERKKN